ncbi:MAG: hypothetical protein AAF738_02030 [Bacteroidota bacterium]
MPLAGIAQNIFPKFGDAGIGIKHPAVSLHIKSNNEILRLQSTERDGYLQFMNIDGAKGYIGIYRYQNDVQFGTSALNSAGKVHLVTNARPKLTVDKAGFVGIGTTNPKRKMHLIGNALRIATAGNSARYLELRTDGEGTLSLEATEESLYLQSLTDDTFIQPFSGGVGIGVKAIPEGCRFAVAGRSIFEEVYVDLKSDWPDYVFEDKYEGFSITALSEFIQRNGHLPWFPSATEVQETGIDVATVQQNSVEAIENLSIYIIELEQQVAQKDLQLQDVQAQLKTMQTQIQRLQAQLNHLIQQQ